MLFIMAEDKPKKKVKGPIEEKAVNKDLSTFYDTPGKEKAINIDIGVDKDVN